MLWKNVVNQRLEQLGHTIKVESILDQHGQEIDRRSQRFHSCLLSTGLLLETLKEFQLFKRRMKFTPVQLSRGYASRESLIKFKTELKKQAASKGGQTVWANILPAERSKIASLRAIKCWKEGKWTEPACKGWNSGLTKKTSSSILKMSQNRFGKDNPMSRENLKLWSAEKLHEYRCKLSLSMKRAIIEGRFTPHVHNSNSDWTASLDQKKYRSSLEAAVALILGKDYVFEGMRIPYDVMGRSHVYIVDFYSAEQRTLVEVKHSGRLKDVEISKINAGRLFAEKNNLIFKIMGEEDLKNNRNLLIANQDRFSVETWKKIEKYL